jgi:hypothetical protein
MHKENPGERETRPGFSFLEIAKAQLVYFDTINLATYILLSISILSM